jgi:hypothetical protein
MNTQAEQLVLDPFPGSGPVAEACKTTGVFEAQYGDVPGKT